MRIEIAPEAGLDLDEAFYFYEKQAPGLGRYFLNCLFADIDKLKRFAGIHAREQDIHRSLPDKFPFAIYYDIRNDLVTVLAVVDRRRDPDWIKQRLSH